MDILNYDNGAWVWDASKKVGEWDMWGNFTRHFNANTFLDITINFNGYNQASEDAILAFCFGVNRATDNFAVLPLPNSGSANEEKDWLMQDNVAWITGGTSEHPKKGFTHTYAFIEEEGYYIIWTGTYVNTVNQFKKYPVQSINNGYIIRVFEDVSFSVI